MSEEADRTHMQEALDLAAGGCGEVEPNPPVGAVVVGPSGEVVGRGYHRFYGGPHAEVEAVAAAGVAARGATLYVTLEPCSTHGKTPPCCDTVLGSGVVRVVCAAEDPNPAHAGAGIRRLRDRGITVDVGVAAPAGEALLHRFRDHLKSSRPWVIAKWAMSLDGAIATAEGDSKWISSEASRAMVHTLRGRVDGIAVGVGTVAADNPRLTARPRGPRTPARIVFDDRLEVPNDWVALHDDDPSGRPFVVHQEGASPARATELDLRNARRISVPATGRSGELAEGLRRLRSEGVNRLLVEGGAGLLGAMFDADCVDQVVAFLAPSILGGRGAIRPVGGEGVLSVAGAPRIEASRVSCVGDDVMITGFVERRTRSRNP